MCKMCQREKELTKDEILLMNECIQIGKEYRQWIANTGQEEDIETGYSKLVELDETPNNYRRVKQDNGLL